MEILCLVQPDAFCIHPLGDYSLFGSEQEKFLYLPFASIVDDIGMFNLYLHCTRGLLSSTRHIVCYRRDMHIGWNDLVHYLVQKESLKKLLDKRFDGFIITILLNFSSLLECTI